MSDIIQQKFTTQSYRVIAFAYKDVPVEDFERLKYNHNSF